ncbi:MAG TPA: hypothetical protein VFE05_13500 [Longimicrobiaceae bacterium]|jgi:hypothetical protein|nr:hypothetical protein [Longimicrobiaceae bacterium]
MKKLRLLALAGLLAVPATAHAQAGVQLPPGQTGPQLPRTRWAVTPFVGVRVPFTTGAQHVFVDSQTVSPTTVRRERGGAPMVGAEAEMRIKGPWSLVGTAAYSQEGSDVLSITLAGDSSAQAISFPGSSALFTRLGVSYRLPEPNPDSRRFHPAGFIVAAPALVRTHVKGGPSVNNWAANVGVQATAPLGRSQRLAFQIAFDDYITFWNADARLTEDVAILTPTIPSTTPLRISYGSNNSNIIALRFGASFRL